MVAAKRPVVFIVGATASGKSAVAMKVAEQLPSEILCADSQTLRKHLNIGTAKPSKADQKAVPHHGLDLIEPYERYSVADYKRYAETVIQEVQLRGRLPLIVGGSGLYIDALFFNYSLDEHSQSDDLETKSVSELQAIIRKHGYPMPKNEHNPRHLVGVIRRKGLSPKDVVPRGNAVMYGIRRSDEILKRRIHLRIEQMFNNGLVEEVKSILDEYGQPPKGFDAIAYPIITRLINGEIGAEGAKQQLFRADWQYVRRQIAWFKRNSYIHWFEDADDMVEHIVNACR